MAPGEASGESEQQANRELDKLSWQERFSSSLAACCFLSDLPRAMYHVLSTHGLCRLIMAIAKLFRTGGSEAIRLPKEFRVDTDTVQLKRTSQGFLVITRDSWDVFFEGVELLSDDFMKNLAWNLRAVGKHETEPPRILRISQIEQGVSYS